MEMGSSEPQSLRNESLSNGSAIICINSVVELKMDIKVISLVQAVLGLSYSSLLKKTKIMLSTCWLRLT